MTVLLTAIAGGLGGTLRFWVDTVVSRSVQSNLPWGTFAVNTSACLALGLLTGIADATVGHDSIHTLVGVGLLGGYSTFSTASVEVMRLIRQRLFGASLIHAVGMLALSLAAAAIGVATGHHLA